MSKDLQAEKKTRTQWKNGVIFPDEELLMIRPCLIRFCQEVRPAAKLLAALLYHSRNCSDQDTHFTWQSTQSEIINDLCGEVCAKTLHDVAVPALWLLGLLEVDESSYIMTYTLRLDRVRQLMAVYRTRSKSQPELEKILIVFIREQLEKVLIPIEDLTTLNKKIFQEQLEKVLIQIRKSSNSIGNFSNSIGKSSNSRRGRKPRTEATATHENEDAQNLRDSENLEENHTTYGSAGAEPPSLPVLPDQEESKQASYSQGDTEDAETIDPVATGKAVPPCITSQDSLFGGSVTRVTPLRPSQSDQDKPEAPQGKGTGKGKGKGKGDVVLFPTGARVEERKPAGTGTTKKEKEVVLTDEERRVFDLYCQLWFITIPPKITEDRKLHCGKLAPHVNTLDDMKALEKIARRKLKALGIGKKLLELGNLVNAINDWKAEQMPAPEEEEDTTTSQDRRPAFTGGTPRQGQAVVSPEIQQQHKSEQWEKRIAKIEQARVEKRKLDPDLLAWAELNGIDTKGVEPLTEEEMFELNTRKRA